jgi:hypothetical protein
MPDADQLLGMGIGQRFQQDALDHAEDHRVCAYADGQGEQRDGGKHGRAAEPAHHLPELIDQHSHLPDLRGAFDCIVA